MPKNPPGKLLPLAYGFGRFRITRAESLTPSGIFKMRPGIGTNVAEFVCCVPLVCAYKAIVALPLLSEY